MPAELLALILGPEGTKVDLGVLRGQTKRLINTQVGALVVSSWY
jgi:hypothetical protein